MIIYLTSQVPEHEFIIWHFDTTNIKSNSWNNSIRRETFQVWVNWFQLLQQSLTIKIRLRITANDSENVFKQDKTTNWVNKARQVTEDVKVHYRFPSLVNSKNEYMKLRLAKHILPESIKQWKHLSLIYLPFAAKRKGLTVSLFATLTRKKIIGRTLVEVKTHT